jgi:hypothetical protein
MQIIIEITYFIGLIYEFLSGLVKMDLYCFQQKIKQIIDEDEDKSQTSWGSY